MNFTVASGRVDESIEIFRETARWLVSIGEPLWKIEDLTKERMTANLTGENFLLGLVDGKPAAAMVLQWHDPLFWEDIEPFESGFLHKLSVRREFAGMGISSKMLAFAESKCVENGVRYLRLDCAGEREKLRALYIANGFTQVERKKICALDVALFEKRVMEAPVGCMVE